MRTDKPVRYCANCSGAQGNGFGEMSEVSAFVRDGLPVKNVPAILSAMKSVAVREVCKQWTKVLHACAGTCQRQNESGGKLAI